MAALKFYLRNPLDPPRIPQDSWRSRAACAGHPFLKPWVWDDKVGPDDVREDVETRVRRVAQAKAVCRSCPSKDPCLADVDLTLDSGVRGGVDLRERQKHESGDAA